jgi:hypothetical protein
MAHGMTSTMTLLMALMMILMVGSSIAFGARRVLPAARRALGGSRHTTAGTSKRGDG